MVELRYEVRGIVGSGGMPPNNRMQRTALRPAADAERWADRRRETVTAERVPERPSYGDIAVMLAAITFVAGIGVPPSYPRADLSTLEGLLERSIVPLLAIAGVLAIGAIVASLARSSSLDRWLVYASVLLINLSGVLGGLFGVESIGVGGTLLLTSPVIAVIAWRGLRTRRVRS